MTKNNQQNKCIKKYTYFGACMKKFRKLKKQADNIVIPKRYGTYNGLHNVKYDMLLLKRKLEGESVSTYKDYNDWGVLQEYNLNDDDWKILDKINWYEEEKFYVYGLKKRLTCLDIYQECLIPKIHYFTQIIKIFNKLVIDDGDDVEVILCKTEADCDLLYHKLLSFATHQQLSSLLFLGNATFQTRKQLRQRLCEFTGLKEQEFYRKVSKSYL